MFWNQLCYIKYHDLLGSLQVQKILIQILIYSYNNIKLVKYHYLFIYCNNIESKLLIKTKTY